MGVCAVGGLNRQRETPQEAGRRGGTSMPLSREDVLDVCEVAVCGGIGIPVVGSRAPGTCTYRCVRPVLVLLYLNLPQVPLTSTAEVSQLTVQSRPGHTLSPGPFR